MSDDEKIKAMDKLLGEPFGLEFQEDVLKTRRNLLLASVTSVFVAMADLRLVERDCGGPVVPILGGSMTGLQHVELLWCLSAVIAYLWVHFVWGAWDAAQEYWLRRSGARVRFQTGSKWGEEGVDAPVHPRQATLYSWWQEQARMLQELLAKAQLGERDLDAYLTAMKKQHDMQQYTGPDLHHVIDQGNSIQKAIVDLKAHVEAAGKVQNDARIKASLARFDAAFSRRALSQSYRWIVLEFGFPALLGLWALYVSLSKAVSA